MDTFSKVKVVLCESLGVDEDIVTMDSRLYQDLGAESIDMMDITFRLERDFGTRLNVDEMFPTGVFRGSDEYMVNGKVTPAGVAKLREAIPHGDFSKVGDNPSFKDVTAAFTAGSLVRFLDSKFKSEAA